LIASRFISQICSGKNEKEEAGEGGLLEDFLGRRGLEKKKKTPD